MRATKRRLRRSLAFGLVAVGFTTAFAVRGHAASNPAEADVFALQGVFRANSVMPSSLTSMPYTVQPTACMSVSLPAPVSTSVPGFVDIPNDESGVCTGMTGGGTFNIAQCSTGQVSADWQITEPAADSAHFVGAGIMVGGLAILATPTVGGYTDDARSGQGAAVALILPDANQTCGVSLQNFNVTAVVAGAY
jgi:hypothetical protein